MEPKFGEEDGKKKKKIYVGSLRKSVGSFRISRFKRLQMENKIQMNKKKKFLKMGELCRRKHGSFSFSHLSPRDLKFMTRGRIIAVVSGSH